MLVKSGDRPIRERRHGSIALPARLSRISKSGIVSESFREDDE